MIAESFERIHRSNLVGLGVLPLEFPAGTDRKTLGLDGGETFTLAGIATSLAPRGVIPIAIRRPGRAAEYVSLRCRIDTDTELGYYRHGGILHYVLRGMVDGKAAA